MVGRMADEARADDEERSSRAMLMSDFDERTFRGALSAFATGVAVVTTVTKDGERLGLTVSSFNSVSLSPPLVLFSVGKRALTFPAWQQAQRYVVNVLGEHQQDLSNRFGRASANKWEGLDVAMCEGGPVLADALVAFDCSAYNRYDAGDHDILVGRVIGIGSLSEPQARPLIFFGGRYRQLKHEARHASCDSFFW